jgi:hypothetical protein
VEPEQLRGVLVGPLAVGHGHDLAVDVADQQEFVLVRQHLRQPVLVVPLLDRVVDRARTQGVRHLERTPGDVSDRGSVARFGFTYVHTRRSTAGAINVG